ncbi:MAG TPA: hypothetical protein VK665_11505 [Candidatus Elarobacter sp.]|nr:hypothetical protein [Candidatus Elarobacter sp.]
MHAELRLLIGIILAHAVWAVAYVTGTLLDRAAPRPATRAEALADFVVRSASGLALWGFGAFVLGSFGMLNVWGLAVLLAALAAAGRLAHGPDFFAPAFWRDRAARVGLAFGRGELVVYYAALATVVPAAYPDFSSDSVRYHLAYAMDWANHGSLFIDRFLRQPLYANNFLLLFAALDVLRLQDYVHFLTWLCGALAALAVRAVLALFDAAAPPSAARLARLSRTAVTVLLPLTILVPAVFLRYVDVGYVDIPIELYGFVPLACGVAALLAKRDLRWSAACCGAFAIGMKVTLIALAPLFVAAVWVAARAAGGSRRGAALACSVMLLAGSPWYLRNLYYDRDPVPPVLNILLGHPDLTYSKADAEGVLHDIAPDRSARALLSLPYRMWIDPADPQLREYGGVAMSLFVYVPFAVAAAALMLGARTPRRRAVVLLSAGAAYGVAYCILTTYLLRYLLLVQPALAASLGGILLSLPSVRFVPALRIAAAVLSVVPTPSAVSFYRYVWDVDYRGLEARLPSDSTFLGASLAGYPETMRLLSTPPFRSAHPPRALLVMTETDYYFRRAGVQTVGDWFGPGRYSGLQAAIENDRLADYLTYFDVGGVIFKRRDQRFFTPEQVATLVRTLPRLGFRILENDPDGYLVAVRSNRPSQ